VDGNNVGDTRIIRSQVRQATAPDAVQRLDGSGRKPKI